MPDARQAGWLRRCLAACVASAFVALGAAGCASNGAAKAADPARVQRLGALFVQTMPIGWIAERVAQLDPQWPMQQHAGKFGNLADHHRLIAATRTDGARQRLGIGASDGRFTGRIDLAKHQRIHF